jgi:hypothetical protein
MALLNLQGQPHKIKWIKRKKIKKTSAKKQVLFLKSLNPNFSITLDTIVITLLGSTQLVHFLKTIVEGLRAQKLLNFYSLDYPTKVAPNPKNKNTLNSIFC